MGAPLLLQHTILLAPNICERPFSHVPEVCEQGNGM